MGWTPEIYQARIESGAARRRHAAGSPSSVEIDAYRTACDGLPAAGRALVLGMTPELRSMAADRFQQVVSVDSSQTAIDLFTDWMPGELQSRELIIRGQWCEVECLGIGLVDVVLGDGIIANLRDFQESVTLLERLRRLLAPGGRIVMRNVILPAGIDLVRFDFARLLSDFRQGLIDAAEFGFSSRMLGFHQFSYDEAREILDNAFVYETTDGMLDSGLIDAREADALARYRFMGRNYIPVERTWHSILEESGFGRPVTHPAEGRLWETYYPVQSFDTLT